MKNQKTLALIESALMIAIAMVLNEFVKIGKIWALGGGITLCSMLPLVFISYRHGVKQGLFTAFVFSLLQLVLGMKNVHYGQNFVQMAGIALLDYIIAYSVIGFAGMYKGMFGKGKEPIEIMLGILVSMLLRFLCHYLSGFFIWEALWPNEHHYTSHAWSFIYNASYMGPETLLTMLVAFLSFIPLKKIWLNERI